MKPPTESKIEAKLVRWCRQQCIYTRKFVSPATKGVPDRIFIRNGKVLFMELKRPGNKTTALQDYEIAQLHKAGASAVVATGYEEAVLKLTGFFFVTFTAVPVEIPSSVLIDPTSLI